MMMAMLMISALSIKGQEQIEDSPLIIILNIRKKITDYWFFIYLCKCLAALDIIIIERWFSLFYSVFALHQHYCYQLKIKYIEPC